MKIKLDTPTEEIRIEIVPLIDVIFCILTFFILASLQLTRQQAINVDLPKASSATPQTREILMVSLDDFGKVYVEQQPFASKEQFTETVKNYHQANPNGLMVLYASPSASYNQVVQLLDLMRQVGGDRVALATQPTGNAAQTPNPNTSVPPPPEVPGIPGIDPSNPSGTPYPVPSFDPSQPQLLPTPGQSGVYPINPSDVPATPVPTPDTKVSPKKR